MNGYVLDRLRTIGKRCFVHCFESMHRSTDLSDAALNRLIDQSAVTPLTQGSLDTKRNAIRRMFRLGEQHRALHMCQTNGRFPDSAAKAIEIYTRLFPYMVSQ